MSNDSIIFFDAIAKHTIKCIQEHCLNVKVNILNLHTIYVLPSDC